mgnify:CR=1 FL=1
MRSRKHALTPRQPLPPGANVNFLKLLAVLAKLKAIWASIREVLDLIGIKKSDNKPRIMTREEEERWFKRADGSSSDGGGP